MVPRRPDVAQLPVYERGEVAAARRLCFTFTMPGEIVPFRRKRPSKYDWTAAWLFFCSDPTITYGDVAKKYGMNVSTVTHRAAREKWSVKRDEILTEIEKNAQDQAIRSMTERHERTILVAEKLRDVILDPNAEIGVKEAVAALPAYAKLEQLFGGGATENLRAMPMIDPDNLSTEELEELARLLEKGRGEAA